jgi:glycosyltransferase involved in cell wall biosynthesis
VTVPNGRTRLKVLHLIDALVDRGGAERFAVGLLTHLPPDRFELYVCSTRRLEAPVQEILTAAGVKQLNLDRRRKYDIHQFGNLISLIRRERFDILHAHMFGSNLWGTLIGTAYQVPVIIAHEQTWSYEGQPLRRWADGFVIGRLATRFVAVSSKDAERMVALEHVPPKKVVMIPNAYVPRPGSVENDLRSELGLDPATPLLATVAVFRPQKGLSVLLDAFAEIVRAVPDAHLVLAGDGELRPELQAQTARLGLTERVHFLGFRDDIDAILRSADVALLSSDYEGTPLVIYESIANGTPVVSTDVGGLRDIVEDGRSGRLVPRRNPTALAEATIELLRSPALRERLAREAADTAAAFSIESVTRRFAALYELLIAEARNGSVRA